MHWFETRLVTLIGTFYATAMARAIAALPNDDLDRSVALQDQGESSVRNVDSAVGSAAA